jgi:hypothetical protein
MAQHDYIISNATFPAVRTDLNNALSAIQTTNSGTSRPTGAVAGQLWLDTTSPTTPTLKYYDGADDISLATIDHSANTVNWLDSTVSITGLSTTATGTVLTLSDSVNTTTVNLIIDNQKEIRFRETTANGTNYVALKAPASVASDLTFTLPATDGASGQALVTNGSGVLSFASAGLAWQSVVTASTLTSVAGRGYFIDTTSNACTVTLPASATAGDTIILVDYARNWGINAVTINQNSLNFQGFSSPNPVYNTNRQSVTLVYSGATQGWIPTVDDDVTFETPQPYSVDFLVIAGGGAGGNNFSFSNASGGGGGAGGYRNSFSTETSGGGGSSEATLTFTQGIVYTVTVGAGAGTNSTNNAQGGTGNNSSISGTGITTITSSGGGGGGGSGTNAGASGGSGGGSCNSAVVGNGTANQGFNGGQGGNDGGGGGGGASAVGATTSTTTGGNGGNGLASSITGSSVTRGGGGGGSGGATPGGGGTKGTGGTGGGGNGAQSPSTSATAGSANTGGGGGGGNADDSISAGGAGGSGVVILRMPTANYSGTTTGSPTVTTDGSDTVVVFNSSGSITG